MILDEESQPLSKSLPAVYPSSHDHPDMKTVEHPEGSESMESDAAQERLGAAVASEPAIHAIQGSDAASIDISE